MIEVICLGKIKEEYLKDLISDYTKRINKYLKLTVKELPDSQNILDEEASIIKALDNKSYKILLDINGKKLNSVELSNLIDKTFISYPKITFIIGGSDGVTDKIKSIVDYRLSFSDFTFPHGLFRGVLLEQIYRSLKIINHESYHK
ncbi:MAG: 23S rRNA (pseudouridine(1915)-N(3))-methyltransferase RlmH [Bacilli bacterium]|nr:23S rRNA (pseudouridine(1915)-N(3))-methyltransferase RlmH [Bacilli bacterium]